MSALFKEPKFVSFLLTFSIPPYVKAIVEVPIRNQDPIGNL